ncbi:hypothetical protein LUZ60_008403 [Juncus effusus]|nr:hypothetical protein LUZ60_008403 [Juncus effusus]
MLAQFTNLNIGFRIFLKLTDRVVRIFESSFFFHSTETIEIEFSDNLTNTLSAMASMARAFEALMHRATLASAKNPSAIQRVDFIGEKLQCVRTNGVFDARNIRRISTFQPVCMGRRSCKIAGRKDAQNLKKMKRNSKIGKEIVAAIKKGGLSPKSNTTLAAVLEKARALEVPKDFVERNIKRASEKDQETFIEKIYEVYGFGGVGMIVEVLTDKITRSVASVRGAVKDCGAKLADPGSIIFKFKRVRVVNVRPGNVDKDVLLSVALDCGADDVIEPSEDVDSDDEEEEEESEERYYKIITTSEGYEEVLSKLREEGIEFEQDSGYELLPLNPIEVDEEAMELNKELMNKLLELDDVDAVYSDQK